MTVIYLLRHGQTEHNVEGRIQGRRNSPLTDLGKARVRAIGMRLRELLDGDDFEIVSSPLGRAAASAEIIREVIGAPAVAHDARLMEIGCGSWEGRTFAAISASDPAVARAPCFLAAWARHCPDGEPLDAALGRVTEWLAWAKGRKLIAVGHGIAESLARALYLELDKEDLLRGRSAPQAHLYRLADGCVEPIACAD